MTQPRLPAGAKQLRTSTGGRWTNKNAPDIDNDPPVGFGDAESPAVGPPHDWDIRTVQIGHNHATFTRSVNEDGVVSITSDCEPPDMMLLARKGDKQYWNGDAWRRDHKTRWLWRVDITLRMLREGLVSTAPLWLVDPGRAVDPVQTAMYAAGGDGGVGLTAIVAHVRGLRLVQTMAPADGCKTKFDGYDIPREIRRMLTGCFDETYEVYKSLHQPPWDTTTPEGVPWGPQRVAGHTRTRSGGNVFVGEHADLIWRALTEPEHGGLSALKAGLLWGAGGVIPRRMATAAALYDDTAAEQLTTGLFDGVDQHAPRRYTKPGAAGVW